MLEWIFLITALLVNLVTNSIMKNDFSKRLAKNRADLYVYTAATSVVAIIAYLVWFGFQGQLALPTTFTLVHGIVFGLTVGLSAIFTMLALEAGPMAYTNIFLYCSMIIPSVSGLVLYGEPVTLWQWVGCGLMIVSMVCSIDSKASKDNKHAASLKWLILCLGAFAMNGGCGVSQKVYQHDPAQVQLGEYLILCYIVGVLLAVVMMIVHKKKTGETATVLKEGRKQFIPYALIAGVGMAFTGLVTTWLAGAMPAMIFFPVYNGAALLLSCLAGLLIWKEKFTKKQWVGMAAGIVALVLLFGLF